MTKGADRARLVQVEILEDAICRLREADALLESIELGELLDGAHGDDALRRRQCAVSLLAVLRRDLDALACELQSAASAQVILDRITGQGARD